MTAIVNIANEIVLLVDMKLIKAIGIIDLDYGLIKYLLKILSEYSISVDRHKYLHIENRLDGATLVHRIILEYYAKYDKKLRQALEDNKLEVNHIDKNVWNNKLENLEIVTKADNLKHRYNKDYEVYLTSSYICEIQEKLKNKSNYRKNKMQIENAAKKNDEMLSARN